MKKILNLILPSLLLIGTAARAQFVENKGQVLDVNENFRPEVKFYYSGPDVSIYFLKDRVVYAFRENDKFDFTPYANNTKAADSIRATLGYTQYRLDMEFVGANPDPVIETGEKAQGDLHFYLNKRNGIRDVGSFKSIRYKNVYNQVDVVFYELPTGLKYDIVLHEGARIEDVRILYNGAENIRIENKKVILKTKYKTLEEAIPLAYVDGDKSKEIEINYRLDEKGVLSFEKPEAPFQTLTIDPVLEWATYFNQPSATFNSSLDYYDNRMDADGNTYLYGHCYNGANGYPTVAPGGSAYQASWVSYSDLYLAKFDANRALVWGTYLGGSSSETSIGSQTLAIYGNTLHVVGSEMSAGAPFVNGGGYYNQYTSRPFWARFNKNTCQLEHLTSLPGGSSSYPSIAISNSGVVAIICHTYGDNLYNVSIVNRAGAYNQATNGGYLDMYLMMFNTAYAQTWGTFLGGPSSQENFMCAFDNSNNLYFIGETGWYTSGGNAGTPTNERLVQLPGAYYQSTPGGGTDVMLGKFNSSGALVWHTLFGGNNSDARRGQQGGFAKLLIHPGTQEPFIAFNSTSSNLPMSNLAGAYNKTAPTANPNFAGSSGSFWNYAAYIAKFSTAGALNYASYWHNWPGTGDGGDLIMDMTWAGCDKLYIAGCADRGNTGVALSGGFNMPGVVSVNGRNTFITQVNSNTYAQEWASFLTDNTASDPSISGQTNSPRVYIASKGYYNTIPTVDPGNGAYYNANSHAPTSANFGLWQLHPSLPPQVTGDLDLCSGETTLLTASGGTGAPYNWYTSNTSTPAFHTGSTYTTPALSSNTTYYVSSGSGMCESPRTPVPVVVTSGGGTPFSVTGGGTICTSGSPLNIGLNGSQAGISYQLYFNGAPEGVPINGTGTSFSFGTFSNAGTYTVVAGGSGGTCSTNMTGSATITVLPTPATPGFSTNSPVCAGGVLQMNGPTLAGTGYFWSGPNGFTSSVEDPQVAPVTAAASGTYSLYVVSGSCTSATATQTVTVNPLPVAPNFTVNSPLCAGATLNFTGPAVGGATYAWSGPNGFTSAVQNPSITGTTTANTGTYTLNVTVNGCTSANASQAVTVNAAPVIALGTVTDPTGCGSTNGSIQITGSGSGTVNWTGTASGSATSVTLPHSIPNLGAGSYSITYVSAAGCTSNVLTQNLASPATPATPDFTTNSPLCAGATLNLDGPAIGGATYVWSGPNGFTASVEDPSVTNATAAATGTYSLYVVVSGCTSATATQSVTVNAVPATPSFTVNSPVCEGTTLNFTGPAVTGATYAWTGPGGFTSAVQSPTITGSTTAHSGTYSLTVTVNGCGSAAATQTVTVNSTPVIALGTVTQPSGCGTSNGSIQVTGTGSGSLGWTGTATGIAPSVTLPHSIPNLGAGNYSIAYVSAAGCTSNVLTQTLVNPATPATPTFTSNSPVCAGATLNLDAAPVTNATYVWSGPNGFTASVEDPQISSVTAAASGTYSLYVVVSGCTSATATQSVTVNAVPATPTFTVNSPVCEGTTLNFTGPAVTGATYAWTGPGGFTSAAQSPTITGSTTAHSGTYSLTVTVNGCGSAAATQTVTVNPTPAIALGTVTNPTGCGQSTGSIQITGTGAGGIGWTGGATGVQPGVTLPYTINNLPAGNYSIGFLSAAGCSSNVVVTVLTPPATPAAPAFTNNGPLCAGGNLQLTATPVTGATYVWSGPNGFSANTANPTINPATAAASGSYSLYVVVNNCTSATTTQTVIVNPLPATPTFGSNAPVCSGSTLSLDGPTVAGATYAWTGPNGFSANTEDASIPSATAAATGTYSLTVTVNGCTSAPATQTLTVYDVPPAPTVTASNNPVCTGADVLMTAGLPGATGYLWTGPGGFTSNSQTVLITAATAANAGTYNVYAVLGTCTSATATLQLNVIPGPAVTYTGPLQNCGSQVTLTAQAVPAAGAVFAWSLPGASGSGASFSHTYAGSLPHTLTGQVKATGPNGCADSIAFTVQLIDKPVADFSFEDQCNGSAVAFTEEHGGTGTPAYTWSFGGTGSTLANPGHVFGAPGTYPVTLTVSFTGTPCKDTMVKNIVILPVVQPKIGAETKCLQEMLFSGSAEPDTGLTKWEWSFGDGETASGHNAPHTYKNPGTYTVTWQVETANGCTFSQTQTVTVELSSESIPEKLPNVFTPNGDAANNEINFDDILGECGEYEAVFFNRWGAPVFTQKNGTAPFVGKTQQGTALSEGVYFYVLKYGDSQKGGHVTLSR